MGERTLLEGTRDFRLGNSHREFPIGKMDDAPISVSKTWFSWNSLKWVRICPFWTCQKDLSCGGVGKKPPKRRNLMFLYYGNACFGPSGQILGNPRDSPDRAPRLGNESKMLEIREFP